MGPTLKGLPGTTGAERGGGGPWVRYSHKPEDQVEVDLGPMLQF